jgi:hypothetical protein
MTIHRKMDDPHFLEEKKTTSPHSPQKAPSLSKPPNPQKQKPKRIPQVLIQRKAKLILHLPQLRAPQVQRNEPHHQSQGPRQRADQRRQGRREWPVHGREPGLCAVWLCALARRVRRLPQPPRPEGRLLEERLERQRCAIESLTPNGFCLRLVLSAGRDRAR